MTGGVRCAVVGAGVVGVFCTYFLLRRGHHVTLFDQYPAPFQGTTAAGFGSLTPFSDPFFEGEVSRFAQTSVALYRNHIVPDLAPFGRVDMSADSLLHLVRSRTELEDYIQKLEGRGHRSGVDFRTLTTDEAVSLEPGLCPEFDGAIEYTEPWIDTNQLLTTLLSSVRASSAFIGAFNRRVSLIHEGADVVIVEDQLGAQLEFDKVIVASGASTAAIGGIPTPMLRLIRGDAALAVSPTGQPLVSRHVYMDDAFITPRLNGEHLLGASYEIAPNDQDDVLPASRRATAKASHLVTILQGCMSLVPALQDCEIGRVWHGWRPSTPSGIPYVGLMPGCGHIWSALGFIGLGVTLAPAVGQALAKAIENDTATLPTVLTAQQPDLWRTS